MQHLIKRNCRNLRSKKLNKKYSYNKPNTVLTVFPHIGFACLDAFTFFGSRCIQQNNFLNQFPFFISRKLGTSEIYCGDKISKKPCLFTFSGGK